MATFPPFEFVNDRVAVRLRRRRSSEVETFLSSLSLLLPHRPSLNVGLCDGDDFLDFPHHHDACEHLLQLLARDWLG